LIPSVAETDKIQGNLAYIKKDIVLQLAAVLIVIRHNGPVVREFIHQHGQ
jgi:hypothetical protein